MYLVWRALEFLNNSSTVSSKMVKKKIGAPRKRYKDYFKSNLKDFNIDVIAWEKTASDSPAWRRMISNGALLSEENRLNAAKLKRIRRKAGEVDFPYTGAKHAQKVFWRESV